MAYDLDQFIADARAALKRDSGPAGRESGHPGPKDWVPAFRLR